MPGGHIELRGCDIDVKNDYKETIWGYVCVAGGVARLKEYNCIIRDAWDFIGLYSFQDSNSGDMYAQPMEWPSSRIYNYIIKGGGETSPVSIATNIIFRKLSMQENWGFGNAE